MAKPKRKKQADNRGPIQRLYDEAHVANDQSSLDVLTPEQARMADYDGHGRSYRRTNLLERWFAEGSIGFQPGAKLAVEWCIKVWDARGVNGKQTGSYEPAISGTRVNHEREMELRDELDTIKEEIPDAYWAVFENVVRYGEPAGVAGSSMAQNTPQAIATAKATVGMIASFIAMKRGY